MNDDQKHALVARFWIGRDDAKPQECGASKTPARQQHEGLVSRYLLDKPTLRACLTQDLEKMLEYGVD